MKKYTSEDITFSSSDITSGNYNYTSGIQVDLNVQYPFSKSLMLSTTHTSYPAPAMTPQIPITQLMATFPSLPSASSHPSTLSLDYAPTPPSTPVPFVPSPYSAAPSSPPSTSLSPTSSPLNQPIPVLPPWDSFKLVGDNIAKNIHPFDQRVHRQMQFTPLVSFICSEGQCKF